MPSLRTRPGTLLRMRLPALLVGALLPLAPLPAMAAPDPATAAYVFEQAGRLCMADAGQLWGVSLCGPMMIVDPADRVLIANQGDPGRQLAGVDALFTGVLPPEVVLANTRVEWSGAAWTQLLWPLPQEPALLRVFLAHELFHRVQAGLGLARAEAGNRHLDTLEGRYLLQLEWRALAQALMADQDAARRARIADALALRHARRQLFPGSDAEEAALEINEGLAEYTGVRVGLANPEQRRAHGVYALARFLDAPSFVRSFAYASGPAYGLLLDQADPRWRGRLGPDADLGTLLAAALQVAPPPAPAMHAITGRYDPGGELRTAEEARERERMARLAAWRASLVDGPVLVLPLVAARLQFNPQTLAALDGVGTVYPTLRLTDHWGELRVDGGAALLHADRKRATVALPREGDGTSGEGWSLVLEPGWKIVPGAREGDLSVAGPAASSP